MDFGIAKDSATTYPHAGRDARRQPLVHGAGGARGRGGGRRAPTSGRSASRSTSSPPGRSRSGGRTPTSSSRRSRAAASAASARSRPTARAGSRTPSSAASRRSPRRASPPPARSRACSTRRAARLVGRKVHPRARLVALLANRGYATEEVALSKLDPATLRATRIADVRGSATAAEFPIRRRAPFRVGLAMLLALAAGLAAWVVGIRAARAPPRPRSATPAASPHARPDLHDEPHVLERVEPARAHAEPEARELEPG